GLHGRVADAFVQKGLREAPKDAVEGRDEPRIRTVVRRERPDAVRGIPRRSEVRVDVRPAKGIDGLLRITDQEERSAPPLALTTIDPAKDLVLDRVRVLELVDERDRIPLAHLPGEGRPPRRLPERVAHA